MNRARRACPPRGSCPRQGWTSPFFLFGTPRSGSGLDARRPVPHDTRASTHPLNRHSCTHLNAAVTPVPAEPGHLEEVAELIKDETCYYFLIAAAGLNRTSLKRAMRSEDAQIVHKDLRRAFAVKEHLPLRREFTDVANRAVVLWRADLNRRARGAVEALFRERLKAEGIPILMSPPVRQVPGLLIGKRKPDGVYPDPAEDKAPGIYLEIKNVRRVSDDIQKRLYEVAEASLEMKILYGNLRLEGFGITSTREVLDATSDLRARLRDQIRSARPTVVVLFLCARDECIG